jgi:hypothetical protein
MGRTLATAGLAAAGVPAPIGTLAAVAGARAITVPIAAVAWLALATYVVAAPRLWPVANARAIVVRGAMAAVIALIIGWFVSYGVRINESLCGNHTSPAFVAGGIVYLVAAAIGLQKSRFAVGLWVLAVAIGWVVTIVLLLLLPGAQGYCET